MKLFFLILFLSNVTYSFCQDDLLKVEYYKCSNEYILEIIKQNDNCVKIKSMTQEYIEFKTGWFDQVVERYSLVHEEYNANSLEISFNYNNMKRIELINFDNSNVKHIDLSFLRLSYFPTSVYKITKLESLEMINNDFDSIPIGISNLHHLKKMTLGHTPIKKLPEDFKNLEKLEHLSINYSSIEDKQQFFEILKELPNLQSLELWSVGKDSKLPYEFLKLKNLSRLSVLGSDFDFTLVYQHSNLTELYLNLTTFKTFTDSIKYMINLRVLSISRSHYLQNLPSTLSDLKKMEILSIDYGLGNTYGYTIDTDSTYAIIKSLTNLKKLSLGDYFDKLYPFWENSNLEYFYFDGGYIMPDSADLKKVKQKISVSLDWKCKEMNKINENIICN